MTELLHTALAFPTVVFTVMLVVATMWWLLVLLGVLDLDLPFLPDLDADVDGDATGPLGAALAFFGLTRVPAAVGGSLVVLFAWLLTLLGLQLLGRVVPGIAASVLLSTLVALIALVTGAFAAGLVGRELAPVFATVEALGRHELVGKVCRITSPTVDPNQGRAELDDGAAGLILEVRRPNGATLHRGDEAVIFDYDSDREVFLVAPLEGNDKAAASPTT